MKKNLLYIGISVIFGIVLGALIFSNSNESSTAQSTHPHIKESNNQELWTCSMHPQITKPEAGDCPICGMDLIPAEASADGLAANEIKMTKNAMALANIQTIIVGNGFQDGNSQISLSGKITENADQTATQPAHFDGRVEKLYVHSIGETVTKGQRGGHHLFPSIGGRATRVDHRFPHKKSAATFV